ncbi:MAG: haloacid dehalogenase, partial [Sphingobacteriales bacterium]
MGFSDKLKNKKAAVFGLDNVIYPERDYLLQVYYLFAQFLEYTEQMDAKAVLEHMQSLFEQGDPKIFKETAEKFNIPQKYEENFHLLHQTARLPLKLLLFDNILSLMQEIVVDRKQIY